MLAAAFAFGDADVVERVVQSFPKQKLGLGLKKFSAKSILRMIKVLEQFQGPDIGHKTLSLFISLGVYSSDFDEEAKISFLTEEYHYSNNLGEWGEKFGFHVMHESWLQSKSKASSGARVRFEFDRSSHRRGACCYSEKGGVILSNFRCTFEAPIKSVTEDGEASVGFDGRIRLVGFKRHHNRCTPDAELISDTFAEKIAAGVVQAAIVRLRKLISMRRGEQGISYEHIAIICGNDNALLQNIREHDMHMIHTNNENIASTLRATLKANVPVPDGAAIGEGGDAPSIRHDREINLFVSSYTKLVNLSYCEVPLLSGKSPSALVQEYSVASEALQHKESFWRGRPQMVHANRRLQEKDERERLMRSRMLAVPGKLFSVFFILFAWVFASWLCTATTKKGLETIYPMHPFLFLLGMSQGFTFWLLYSLNAIFKSLFRLSEDCTYWVVVSYCTEYLQRKVASRLGKPTPYDQEMNRLKVICETTFCRWLHRIAKRDFYNALKTKRITNRKSVLLLTEFADNYYETNDEEVVQGVLPVELSEAEEFLKLQVDEQATYTEGVPLSADEALKNYLVIDDEHCQRSSIENLVSLSATVQECVQFSEGERVIVRFDDDNDAGETADDCNQSCSTCTCCAKVERRGTFTASVAFCTATLCFVHIDGETVFIPIPVSIHRCSILDENVVPALETSSAMYTLEDTPDDEDDEKSYDIEIVEDSSDGDEVGDMSSHDGYESEDEDEEEDVSKAQKRPRTVEEALTAGGWVFQRSKKHIKYSRHVKLSDGNSRKQNVTLSKTPSDWRAAKNALSLLRRLDESGNIEEMFMCSSCNVSRPESFFSKVFIS